MSHLSPQDYKNLNEAYQSIYVSDETEQLDEIIAPLIGLGAGYLAGKAGQGFVQGLRGDNKPAATSTKSKFAGARDAAFKKAKAIKGSPVVGPAKAAPAAKPSPAAKPVATKPTSAPAPSSKPTSTAAKPTAPAAKPSPITVAKPKEEPKIKKDVADLKSMQAASQERQKTSAPQLSARAQALKAGGPQGGARERMLNQSFDMFDIVVGHLLDEGYADTEEAALAIMANMSEEWRDSIIDESAKRTPKKVRGAKDPVAYMKGRSDAGKRISGDEKEGPASYASRWHKGSPVTQPGEKPKNVKPLSQSEKDELAYRKANLKKEEIEMVDEASYSAKAARAGKDIGKPGKAFAKIAASAGKRYGSKERGEKVAGAVLAKLRAKRG